MRIFETKIEKEGLIRERRRRKSGAIILDGYITNNQSGFYLKKKSPVPYRDINKTFFLHGRGGKQDFPPHSNESRFFESKTSHPSRREGRRGEGIRLKENRSSAFKGLLTSFFSFFFFFFSFDSRRFHSQRTRNLGTVKMPLTFAQRATDLLSRFQRPDADRKLCISSKMNNDKFAENSVDPNPFRSPLFLFREQVGIESRLERWRTRATRRDIPSNWTTISITISVVSRSFVSEGAQ